MMTQAFYTGLTGLRTNQTAIDVTANNIANINTIGYRGSDISFSSLFEDAINSSNSSSTNNTIGIGTRVSSTEMMETNGSIEVTEQNTDLAINGDGWFGIQNNDGTTSYTRAGDFIFDVNNDLTTTDGMYVLGTMANNIDGTTLTDVVPETFLGAVTSQKKLRFPKDLTYPSIPTSVSSFNGNLGMGNELRTFATTVIDKDNNKNHLNFTFTKPKEQILPGMQWDIAVNISTSDGETIYDSKTGRAEFDSRGALISHNVTTINNNGSEVKIDLGNAFSGITSTTNPVENITNNSDGTLGGELIGYTINKNSEVMATFSNGKNSSVGKIALFHFQNDQGLEKISGTRYSESSNSGSALFFKDIQGNNITGSDVMNHSLETSNVDLSQSLTELIILQRSFDSNSKVVSTADQMLQKAIDMGA